MTPIPKILKASMAKAEDCGRQRAGEESEGGPGDAMGRRVESVGEE